MTMTADQSARNFTENASGSRPSARVITHPTMDASPAQMPDRPEKVEYLVERSISARITRRFSSASRASGSRRSRSMVILLSSCPGASVREHFEFQSYIRHYSAAAQRCQGNARLKCELMAVEGDALQQADREERHDHAAAAVRNQHERDAGHRHHTDVHTDVLDDVECQHRDHAGRDQLAGRVLVRTDDDSYAAPDKDAVQADHGQAARESELLADIGEDEVGLALRHPAALNLRAL